MQSDTEWARFSTPHFAFFTPHSSFCMGILVHRPPDDDAPRGSISMYFRFLAGMVLVVAVSLLGTTLEKQTLTLRRRVSQQQYQLDELQQRATKLRLATHQRRTATRMLTQVPVKPPVIAGKSVA